MPTNIWAFILLLLGGSGALSGIIEVIRRWLARRTGVDNIGVAFQQIHEVYTILEALLASTPAARILLLKSENGGGIPSPGAQLYSSVLFEVRDDRLPSMREVWQRRPIDEGYVRTMVMVHGEGYAELVVADMCHCAWCDRYQADGVQQSLLFRVASTGEAFFYLQLHLLEPVEVTPELRALCAGGVSQISNILSLHHKLLSQ